jgi:hypothetical protein
VKRNVSYLPWMIPWASSMHSVSTDDADASGRLSLRCSSFFEVTMLILLQSAAVRAQPIQSAVRGTPSAKQREVAVLGGLAERSGLCARRETM